MKNTQSLKKRYFAKFSTNLVGLLFALVTTAIIPRGLGPKAYGDFNFLTNFFNRLFPFFTFSTSIGFYTKLSQRQDEFGIVSFYGRVIFFAFCCLFLFIFLSKSFGVTEFLWPDQSIKYVYMAALFAVLTWIVATLTQVSDARGITVITEIARIFQKFIGLLIILAFFFLKALNLTNFFYYQYTILILLIIAFVIIVSRSGFSLFQDWSLGLDRFKFYFKEFYSYSRPLLIYGLVGVFVGLFDRWILQKYSGSIQQGFFGLSLKIGTLCFLFTGAMTSLITREFSIAHKNNDLKEMRRLFRRYIPLLFSVAAFISCFIAVEAEKVTYIFGGSKFSNAVLPMSIMAFYPIHQTYGQLSGSVFYATGQTKLYSRIGLIFLLAGLPIAYFAVAPSEAMGLNAGATGLAVKFVLIQFIAVNVQLFFNSRFLKLNFLKYFAHQLISIGVLVAIAYVVKVLVNGINISYGRIIIPFLISGALYSFFVIAMIYFIPQTFGLRRMDVQNGIDKIRLYIKNKF